MDNGNGVIYIGKQSFEDILCGRKKIAKPRISRVVRSAFDAKVNATVAVIESPDLPAAEPGKVIPNVSDQVVFEAANLG